MSRVWPPPTRSSRARRRDHRTIRRWKEKVPGFNPLVERYAARSLFELGIGLDRLQLLTLETLETLIRTGTDAAKLGAVRTVLSEARKAREELQFKREVALLTELAAAVELKRRDQ